MRAFLLATALIAAAAEGRSASAQESEPPQPAAEPVPPADAVPPAEETPVAETEAIAEPAEPTAEPVAAPEAAESEAAEPEEEGDSVAIDLHGYYRARALAVGNVMYPFESNVTNRTRNQLYLVQRLRLEPEVSYGEWASLHVTLDCLDDVVWGDNAGLASTALFAGDPSANGINGRERPFVLLRRAWIETNVKFGILRVGRQPSDWGLGLLTDSGDGFDDDFGDNHDGASYDQILFATRPISIGRAIAGLEAEETPLILAFAYDKLVENPIEFGTTRPSYDSAWLSDNADDVDDYVLALAWKQDPVDLIAPTDAIAGGVYFVYRDQASTNSEVYILDGFFKLRLWDFFAEGETVWISGHTQAIALGPEVDPVRHLYERKKADILGYLFRLGWHRGMFTAKVETGYASGDDDASDYDFTGRALHPDVNVGLILYEELLAERTRANWVDNEGMWSQGGVYNSNYFLFTGIVEPIDGLQVVLGVLTAWADRADGAVIQETGWLGTELDLGVKYRFWGDHVLAVVEGGWLRPANGPFGLEPYGLSDTDLWTLQSRMAFVF